MRQGVSLHESTLSENYYDILQVSPKASDIVIKAAYRSLAQKYHPDKYDGKTDEADLMMKKINLAYQILSDFHTRQAYDIQLKASLKKDNSFHPNSNYNSTTQPPFNHRTYNNYDKNNSTNWYYQSSKKSPNQPKPSFSYTKNFWRTPWGNFFRLLLWASVLGLFIHFII
jgi:curved DNA-binding protein CbpA